MKNKIDVVINGKVISLRSDESAEHMQKVSLYVDQKITELKNKNLSAAVDDRVNAVLIALNLADDYFKIKDRHTALDVTNQKLTGNVSRLEKENNELNEQVIKLKSELEKVTTEFEEFLQNFDQQKAQSDIDEENHIIPLSKAGRKRKAAN